MKSKITKEWFLILLVSALVVYLFMTILELVSENRIYRAYATSIYYYPHSKYIIISLFIILKFILGSVIFYLLKIHHAKLLIAVKLFLWFIIVSNAFQLLSLTYAYFTGLHINWAREHSIKEFIFISISAIMLFLSKKYIVLRSA